MNCLQWGYTLTQNVYLVSLTVQESLHNENQNTQSIQLVYNIKYTYIVARPKLSEIWNILEKNNHQIIKRHCLPASCFSISLSLSPSLSASFFILHEPLSVDMRVCRCTWLCLALWSTNAFKKGSCRVQCCFFFYICKID